MNNPNVKQLTPTAIGVAAFVIILAGLKFSQSFLNPLLLAFFISIILAKPVNWLREISVN